MVLNALCTLYVPDRPTKVAFVSMYFYFLLWMHCRSKRLFKFSNAVNTLSDSMMSFDLCSLGFFLGTLGGNSWSSGKVNLCWSRLKLFV